MKNLFLFFTGFLLMSCDAYVSLPYVAKNKSSRPVKVFVPYYQAGGSFSKGVDTALIIPPHSTVFLGSTMPRVTGPIGALKRVYRGAPGLCGLKMIQADTVEIGCSRKEWKLRRGVSVLKIR